MSKNKGKPSGRNAVNKTSPGRKANYKRSRWPEEAPTQHVPDATAKQPANPLEPEEIPLGGGSGRNRKAGKSVLASRCTGLKKQLVTHPMHRKQVPGSIAVVAELFPELHDDLVKRPRGPVIIISPYIV